MKHLAILIILAVASFASLEKAHSHNVQLDWDASISPEVVGYNIYYGTSCGIYTNHIDVGNVTSATISNLVCGVTYYFAATAYDAEGNESDYSAEVTFVGDGVITMTGGTSPDNPPVLQFPVVPGRWYEIQATSDIQQWTSIWQSDVMVSNVWMQFTDVDASSYSTRFYRLLLH